MKGKQIIQILMLVVLLSYTVGCEIEVYNPYDPDDSDPVTVVFRVEYHRPEGSIINTKGGYSYMELGLIENMAKPVRGVYLQKENEYLFAGDLEIEFTALSKLFDFYVTDGRRVPDPDSWPFVAFGDIFVLENKQTGIRVRLTNIIDSPYSHTEGKMARCRISKDGSISNQSN